MKYYNEYKQALEYRKKGQYQEALEVIEKVNKLDPKCELVKFELAKLLIIKGTNKSKRIAKKILVELYNTKRKFSAVLELGKLELSEGNYDIAEGLYKSLLDTTWDDDAIFQLSNLEKQRENYDAEEKYLILLMSGSNTIYKEISTLRLAEIKTKQGKYDDANQLYENVLYESENEKSRETAIKKIIFLNIKQENYGKAYAYLQKINDIIKETQKMGLNRTRFYLEYKLGILKDTYTYKSYFSKQVVDYSENKALNHIKSHLHKNGKKFIHTVFYDEIDIEKLFNEVKTKIQYETVKEFNVVDCYMIDCGYPIGMINKRETTRIKVVTISNTKNIISMYPILSFDEINDYSCDLDEISTYEGDSDETRMIEKPMVKEKTRLSQIDKFNKRYGNY